MDETDDLFRSPELMSADDTTLLVVDVQEKLIRLIPGWRRIVWNLGRLIEAARILELPVLASEQYPQGLGPTVAELAEHLDSRISKISFSCVACDDVRSELERIDRPKVLVAGIEAHVCVQQTVLDLMSSGVQAYVAVDAVGARYDIDYQVALRRMESSGATLTTTEAAMFEWCQAAGSPQFKELSALVKQQPPKENT